jgi:hypothetical protein
VDSLSCLDLDLLGCCFIDYGVLGSRVHGLQLIEAIDVVTKFATSATVAVCGDAHLPRAKKLEKFTGTECRVFEAVLF